MNSDQFKFALAGLVLMGCVGGWLTLRARRKAKKDNAAFVRRLNSGRVNLRVTIEDEDAGI